MKKEFQKKIKLSRANKLTKWTPIWAVVRKNGKGKRVHPSEMTVLRRHWRRTKLKIKPRRTPKSHSG